MVFGAGLLAVSLGAMHNSASAAARSGDIRRAQVQTLLKKPLRDPYLLATAVVCLQTSILSLQFI